MANQPTFRDFSAMALRAAFACRADGIVFDDSSRDTFEREWDELSPEARQHWRDIAEIVSEMSEHRKRLRMSLRPDNQTQHSKETH